MQHAAFPLWLIPALAGMAIPVILVPAALLFKRARLNRQLAHKERMEAIRMGVAPPQSLPGAGSVVAIGAGVPAAAVLGAWLTTITVPPGRGEEPLVLAAIVWGCALLISALALATALVLGILQHRACARAARRGPHDSAKPAHDPDAFDLTGRHAY